MALTQSQNVLQNLNSSHRLCLELRSTTSFFYFSVCCTCFCLFSRAGCKINIAQHNGYRIVKTDEANGITIIHCNVKHSLSDEALFTNVKTPNSLKYFSSLGVVFLIYKKMSRFVWENLKLAHFKTGWVNELARFFGGPKLFSLFPDTIQTI